MIVILDDSGMTYDQAIDYFDGADSWARENCETYRDFAPVWVADVSHTHDVMCEYSFEDEREAMLFKLRWS